MKTDALCAQAIQHLQRGEMPAAEKIYQQVLGADPRNFAAQHFLGIIRAQQGRMTEALELLQGALKVDPKAASTLTNAGLVLHKLGRLDEALATYDRACAAAPNFVGAHFNRSGVLQDLGRYEEALGSSDKALTLQPGYPGALCNGGAALAALGRFDAALARYEKALAAQPAFPQALHGRGDVLRRLKRYDEALAVYEKLVAGFPGDTAALYNRGLVRADLGRHAEAISDYDASLAAQPSPVAYAARGTSFLELGRFDEALASFDKALALQPQHAGMWQDHSVALWRLQRFENALTSINRSLSLAPNQSAALQMRARILTDLRRFDEALSAYTKVFAVTPNNADVWNAYGSLLRAMGRVEECVSAFDKAIENKPDYVEALINRSVVQWMQLKRFAPALADLEKAVALDPTYEYARGDLIHMRMQGGIWQGLDADIAALIRDVRAGKRVARPFMFQAISDSPADLRICAESMARDKFPARATSWTTKNRRDKKVRIGYVSADFREQATAYLTAELYELHDRAQFEVIAFDNGGSDSSPMRKRLEKAFDKFVEIWRMTDESAAAAIDAQGIDILVNLNGYFGQGRMGLFARRAAPIQVNYLGFPGTLGGDYFDYIIADQVVVPQDEARFYNEHVAWLPNSYQVNDRKRAIAAPPTREACGLPEASFVFCNFNQSYKLTPSVFAIWMRLLKTLEGSVLWLYESNAPSADNLRREAASHGVAPTRLIFAPDCSLAEHLARVGLADLFLDSFPYNAHTTASDALWAGLPLITCGGHAFAGRVAQSLLQALGLPELVTQSVAEYEALALQLARDPDALANIREKIARSRATQPLFDTPRYCRNLEQAYLRMYAAWRDGQSPQNFTVSE